MDLFTLLGSCLRRWYLTLPMVLLTGLLAVLAYQSVAPQYTGSVSFVVLPDPSQDLPVEEEVDPEAATPGNPYSGQGGSRFAVAVLTRNINSTAFEDRLDLPKDSERTYLADDADTQPIITIEATAESEREVNLLLGAISEEASRVLDEFQTAAGAPEETLYRVAPAVPSGPVQDVTPSRFRAAGAISVIGLALTAGLAAALDALLVRRRRRQLLADAPGASDPKGEVQRPKKQEKRQEPVAAQRRPSR